VAQKRLSRRGFLQTSVGAPALATLAGGTAALAPAQATSAPPKKPDGSRYKRLNKQQAVKLAAMARTLFPHDLLDDAVYLNVAVGIDADMGAVPANARLVQQGLALLGDDFLVSSGREREQQLRKIADTEFFQYLRAQTTRHLYGDPKLWPVFGFEGSSLEKGGYIHRGFDDIDWLPSA
jgi:hypothetical protein